MVPINVSLSLSDVYLYRFLLFMYRAHSLWGINAHVEFYYIVVRLEHVLNYNYLPFSGLNYSEESSIEGL